MISAGELREVLKIYPVVASKDRTGAPTKVLGASFTVRGKRKSVDAERRLAQGQEQQITAVEFVVRFDKRIVPSCVIDHQNLRYEIKTVTPFGFNEGLILTCNTARNGGPV